MSSAIEREANWLEDETADAEQLPRGPHVGKHARSQALQTIDTAALGEDDVNTVFRPSPERVKFARRIFVIVATVVLALLFAEGVILLTANDAAEFGAAP